jgi:putative redox protein
MDVVIRWNEGLQFKGNGSSGHEVVLDSSKDVGGLDQAARPVEMMLLSLCGCTGMDVVSVLNKMRVSYDRFEVGVSGQRETDYPKRFTALELNYHIWGSDIDEEKLLKAINLSLDRYCPIANTLKHALDLTFKYEINPENAMNMGG